MRKFVQSGIGLVEVTIALGLAGVLAIILMKLGEQQTSLQKKAMRNVELTEVYNHFVSMIDSQTACDATFESAKLGDSIDEFRTSALNPNQISFAKVNEVFQATNIKIEEMKILTNTEIQNLINTNKYPGLALTSVATDPYGHAMIQFWVKFNRGKNAGSQAATTAKIFTIPVMMAEYHQTSGVTAYAAKEHCITVLKGKVSDENMKTNGDGYQDLSITAPAYSNGATWGVHCLVVDNTIPVSNMDITKCRSNKP